MATQFLCGAECEVVTNSSGTGTRHWNAPTDTVEVSSTVRSGTLGARSFRFNATAAKYHSLTVAQTIIVGRVWFKFDTLPSATTGIVYATGAGGATQVRCDSSGQLIVQSGTTTVNLGSTISTGDWHSLDFRFDNSTSTMYAKARLDDGADEQEASLASTSGNFTSFRMGVIASATADLFTDDLVLANASGDYPLSGYEIAGYGIQTTSGTHNQTTGDLKDASSTNITNGDSSGGFVDELPGNTTDYVAQVVNRSTTYWEGVYATSGATQAPAIVEQVIGLVAATSSTNNQKSQLYDGTSAADAYSAATVGSTSVRWFRGFWSSAPSGGAWTLTKFQGARIRWGFSTDTNPNPRITSSILEAAFIPVTGGRSVGPRTMLQAVKRAGAY